MGAHLIDGEFQSDKYPTCPRGKVPLSVKDTTAQDLLWEYAQRRRALDAEFSDDLEAALKAAGFVPRGVHVFRVGDVVRHRTTRRTGTVNRVVPDTGELWIDHTGPYHPAQFTLLAPK
jgi:hypothetical protein